MVDMNIVHCVAHAVEESNPGLAWALRAAARGVGTTYDVVRYATYYGGRAPWEVPAGSPRWDGKPASKGRLAAFQGWPTVAALALAMEIDRERFNL